MNAKTKNIITNILGMIVLIITIYEYFTHSREIVMALALIIGLGLFLFKASETTKYIRRFLDKKINN